VSDVREFRLPDLGEGLEDAEIVAWKVAAGDRVELNQTLVEVNTAKAVVEIPSPWEGVVERLHAGDGDVVKVGQPLVSMRVGDDAAAGAGPGGTEAGAGAGPGGTEAGAGARAAQTAAETGAGDAAARAEAETRAAEAETEGGETGAGGDAEGPSGAIERPKRTAVLVGYGVDEEDELARARRRLAAGRPGADAEPDLAAGPVPATPPVRKLAKELGVDLATVGATGPGGRVTREDVQRAAAAAAARVAVEGPEAGSGTEAAPREGHEGGAPGAGPEDAETGGPRGHSPLAASADADHLPVRGTRRLIAEKMSRSIREIPHVTTFLTVDASWILALREELRAEAGERVSPLPIVVRALVEVCREHPKLSSSFDAEASEILLHRRLHVGIATDTEQGLLVPVVRDADRLGIVALGREIARLSEAARTGRAAPNEMVGSTITVTNVGTFGAEFGTPIINHPEAAILALGVIEPRPLVVGGRIEPRPAVTLSLSFDHRVLDGAEAGRAVLALKQLLESPFRLGGLPR
jgi:2-oxoisovalerate dehydrogenase E2 component (dihydrolipoyl transacylase)